MTKASETSGGGKPNFENRTLFHGDNLDFLRGMNSETVHLIATDPPFNKGRDFHSTPDSLGKSAKFQDRWSWDRDIHDDWVDQIMDDYPAVWQVINTANFAWGKDMGAFLCYMGVRLMEMHRVLREDGSLYLHCDPTASHYLKAMLDAIFGKKQFRNEIVWKRITAGKQSQHESVRFGANTDSILFYHKNNNSYFSPYREMSAEEIAQKFNLTDETGEPYYDDSAHIFRPPGLGARPNLCYEWRGFKNRHPSGWTLSKSRLEEEYQKGNFVILPSGKLQRRKYLRDHPGIKLPNLWADIPPVSSPEYKTQKPISLYDRIIKSSSRRGDMVLDPFCGCATTPIAAERLSRQWVGMDIWDGAYEMVTKRFRDENLFVEDGMVAQGSLRLADVIYTKDPPERTDDGDEAAPYLQVRHRRPTEDWQRLSHKEIFARLEEAQAGDGGVVCGGCGRVLEREFMELDHITPRAARGENYITNRILLCVKCNSNKREDLTLIGLMKRNKKTGWMRDERRAKKAQRDAQNKAERIRDEGV